MLTINWWSIVWGVLLVVAAYRWGGWSVPKRWRRK